MKKLALILGAVGAMALPGCTPTGEAVGTSFLLHAGKRQYDRAQGYGLEGVGQRGGCGDPKKKWLKAPNGKWAWPNFQGFYLTYGKNKRMFHVYRPHFDVDGNVVRWIPINDAVSVKRTERGKFYYAVKF